MNSKKIFFYLGMLMCLVACQNKNSITKTAHPNVLFIAVDDLNDWTGSMGGNNQAITPNLDKLSGQGILFTNAHASMAVCVASRNSILSGLHPTTTGWYVGVAQHKAMVDSYKEVMGEQKKMLPEYFKDNGYRTYCAGKIFHEGTTDFPFLRDLLWTDYLPDYDSKVKGELKKRGDGYAGYMFYPFPKNGSQLKAFYGDKLTNGHSLCGGPLDREDIPGGKMYDELIADYAIKKLQEEHHEPFFLSVGFVRPHVPYTAPRKYFEMYDKNKIQLPYVPKDEMNDVPMMGKAIAYNYGVSGMGDYQAVLGLGEDYWRHLVHSYLACISFVDDQIGAVLKALETSKYADNTIIVLWSDHGQNFGEKMTWRKMNLWEESTRVPLYIALPGNKETVGTCSRSVGLLDIYPTLVDLCKLPQPKQLDGRSLRPLLENPEKEWPYPVVSNWRYKNYAVRSERYRYIQYRDGTEELYDHETDQGEHHNLANNNDYKQIIEKHKKWIPSKVSLPVEMKNWEGDELDKTIVDWKNNINVPKWIKK